MDLRTAQTYLTLCETLHFGKTSEEHHMSTSSLSRMISKLEDGLGIKLFERNNRTMRLTPEGKILQSHAKSQVDQWRALENELKRQQKELTGEVSLYCSVTASHSFLYNILSNFRDLHPRVRLKIHTGDPAQGLNRVINNREDIAIIARPVDLPSDIAFRRITTTQLILICPKDSDITPSTMTPASWSSIPLILPETGIVRDSVNRWFERMKVKPNIYAQVAGHEGIASMVSLGLGAGVIPQIVLENTPLKESITTHSVKELGECDVGLCLMTHRLAEPLINSLWATAEL